MLLAIAAEEDLCMGSIDVQTAFLYPKLNPEHKIYMRRPVRCTDDDMPLLSLSWNLLSMAYPLLQHIFEDTRIRRFEIWDLFLWFLMHVSIS